MLQPIPTLPVHHVLWTFVIHPGSVNTSGLFGLFNDVLLELTNQENEEREELLKAECEQISAKATAAGKKGKVSRVPAPVQTSKELNFNEISKKNLNAAKSCARLAPQLRRGSAPRVPRPMMSRAAHAPDG